MSRAQDRRNEKLQEKLTSEFNLSFTKQELIFIFNFILQNEFKVGDGVIGLTIARKIEPFVVEPKNLDNESEIELEN